MVMEKLKGHELFRLLSPKEVERLSAASGVMKLKEGERVYADGFPATHLFVLLKGRVELRRPTKGGVDLLVDDLIEGSLFGVSSLTGMERHLLDAVCVQDSEVLKLEAKSLRQILDETPIVGYAIQKRVSEIFFKRYVETMERLQAVAQAIPVQRT
jgi:signal-transduction protein with cAMP-binding, CBS, and nucleotidyltransferase domain